MEQTDSKALLAAVKRQLGITWDDPVTDGRTEEDMLGGMAYLNEKLGAEADYMVPGTPRTLLFEYCRYARDGALDVFENNYLSLILDMQHGRQVAEFAEKNALQAQQ